MRKGSRSSDVSGKEKPVFYRWVRFDGIVYGAVPALRRFHAALYRTSADNTGR